MKLKIVPVLLVLVCSSQQIYADSLGDCFSALKYDAELQPISDKVALALVDEVTFGMLSNEATPTSDETQAIYKWATKREQCLKSYPPPNNPITQINMEGFNSIQSLILDLYKGAITYGQFARQRQENAKMVDAKIQGVSGQQQQYQQRQYQQQQAYQDAQAAQAFNAAGGTPGQLMSKAYSNVGSAAVQLGAGMLQQQYQPQYQQPQPQQYIIKHPITTKCKWDVLMQQTVCTTE